MAGPADIATSTTQADWQADDRGLVASSATQTDWQADDLVRTSTVAVQVEWAPATSTATRFFVFSDGTSWFTLGLTQAA